MLLVSACVSIVINISFFMRMMILPCHVLGLWPEKQSTVTVRPATTTTGGIPWELLFIFLWEEVLVGVLSIVPCSETWFFFFFICLKLIIVILGIYSRNTFLSWPHRQDILQSRVWVKNTVHKNKLPMLIRQLTPCISIQRNLKNWEFNQLEFGLQMEEGGGKKRIKLMPQSKRQPCLPSLCFSFEVEILCKDIQERILLL